jgi:tripartite-type tricarboxylate transporter receptor subunit TctC
MTRISSLQQRRQLIKALATLSWPVPVTCAWAQSYPSKSIRLISGASAGSASDVIGRAVGERLQNDLGQNVFLENRLGAGGVVAVQALLAAPPDGHTIFVYTSAHTVAPLLSKLNFDPIRDLAGVTPLAVVPNVMVVSTTRGFKTVKDVIDAALAKPGGLNFASVGAGSSTHMSAEKFKAAAGINAVHVPFKGSPEAITETMAGRIDYFFAPLVSALPMIKAGRLTPLAVGTPKRSALLPDVPTLTEAGVPGADYVFWIGMLVSSKTPRDVVQKINQFTLKALQAPEVRERLAAMGADPMPLSPEQFDAMIKEELTVNAAIIKAAGIKTD